MEEGSGLRIMLALGPLLPFHFQLLTIQLKRLQKRPKITCYLIYEDMMLTLQGMDFTRIHVSFHFTAGVKRQTHRLNRTIITPKCVALQMQDICSMCGFELEEPGAIFISSPLPGATDVVKRRYICKKCEPSVAEYIGSAILAGNS